MSQQIGDLLSGKNYAEPPEVQQIKQFVKEEIGITPQVSIKPERYIIQVPSAAAAGALRPCLFKLQKQMGTEKRVVIKIG